MLVIVVSECRKKAFTRSRRVLNKFLFQYGRRTWMGRLSQEGLDALRKELKAKASRHMAVACHRVVGTRRTELLWIVGSRRFFSRSGEYAFAVTERDMMTPVREKTEPERFVAHLTRLAGLLHDLGKSVAGFQEKLRSGTLAPDAIRHDLLSAILLLRLLGITGDGKRPTELPSDPEWLEALRDPKNLRERLDTLCQEKELFPEGWLLRNKDKPSFRGLAFLDPEASASPVLHWLLWLIASHHRLPNGETYQGNHAIILDAWRHCQPDQDTASFRRITEYTPFWRGDTDWTGAVAQAADRLLQLLQRLNPSDLFPLVEAHVRPALLLADQTVSSEKKTTGPLEDEVRTIANTKEQESGQDLARHMTRTAQRASHFARLSLHRQPFPAIDPDELPDALCREPDTRRGPDRFKWQDRARLALRAEGDKGIREGGGFYLLMAGTGKGKTVAVPLLFSELSPRGLRYSLGLGLRTLTLQSGNAYRGQIGFGSDQTATLVGSPIARELYELQQADSGSSDPGFEEDPDYRIDDFTGDTTLGRSLDDFLRTKQRTLLAAPVTVSTVDHLIGPVTQGRTGSAAIHLRLMTSDLALDEIDQYNDRDLVNIGKLIYYAGIYGRRVMLASATLPPAIAENFYHAYQAGFRVYQKRVRDDVPLFCGWFAEEARIEKDVDPSAFASIHAEWTDKLAEDLDREEPLRRAELIETGGPGERAENLRPFFESVWEKANELHHRHHVQVQDRRISIGLVRCMNVPMCRELARYLIDDISTQADVRVVCYHAGHIPAMRYEIERVLDDLLHRKRDIPERLAAGDDTPGIETLRSAMEQSEGEDLLVIVSATTIEDTGRDHDFDWAVWEPNDIRSAPQTAGRVMRHRTPPTENSGPNIAILRRNWRSAVQSSEMPFSWPGPEGQARAKTDPQKKENEKFRVKDYIPEHELGRDDPGDFGAVGPMRRFEQRVDAAASLREAPLGPLAHLEHDRLRWLLGPRNGDPALDGLWGYLSRPGVRASDLHIRSSPFRGGPERSIEFALCNPRDLDAPDWDWQWREPGKRFESVDKQSVLQERDFDHPWRCFLQTDPKEIVRELMTRLNGDPAELIPILTSIELSLYHKEYYCILQFHPYLGGTRKRSNFPGLDRDNAAGKH